MRKINTKETKIPLQTIIMLGMVLMLTKNAKKSINNQLKNPQHKKLRSKKKTKLQLKLKFKLLEGEEEDKFKIQMI